jgi:lysophospholipase L1-like esterase
MRSPWLALCTVLALTACGDDNGGSGDPSGASEGTSEGSGASTGGASAPTTEEPGSESSATGGSVSDSATTGTSLTTTPDPTTEDPTTGNPTTDATTGDGTTGDDTTGDDSTTGAVGIDCLNEPFVNQGALVIDYAQFDPVIGSHCKGTNHQEITDIERVVFLGDSITVGTPPTGGEDHYRAELADVLVDRFGLTPPDFLWKQYHPVDGVSIVKDSGDFSSCSKWGARTDDFIASNDQILDCFPEDLWDKRTLVVITMGGNDLAAIAKDGANGKPIDEVMADAESFIQLMREAVQWFVDDPNKFPNGVFVVFANIYEFTDGTGDLMSCPAAGLGGFDKPWEDPEQLKQLVLWINEQYLSIAVETQTDMIFMLENFCGHGFNADDPMAPCYRGPGSENLFDLTCIHPNPAGHDVIAELFTAVVDE